MNRLLSRPRNPQGKLRIAICQYDTRDDNLRWNIDHAVAFAEEAFRNGADLVILPEFSFNGFSELHALSELIEEFHRLEGPEKLSRVAWRNRGWLAYNHPTLTDGVFYNETQFLDPDGRIAARYHKRYLALIDQRVRFVPGQLPGVVDLPFGRVGFLICRDLLLEQPADQEPDTDETFLLPDVLDAAREDIEQYSHADLIVGQLAYAGWWTPTRRNALIADPISSMLTTLKDAATLWARQTGTYVALANKSGFEHSYGFPGGSLVVAPDGEILGHASSGTEILYVDLPLDASGRIARQPSRDRTPSAEPDDV